MQKSVLATVAAGAIVSKAGESVPARNWDGYNFDSGPMITNR